MGGSDARPLRLDPHVHTAASHDCSTPLSDVLAAASDAGLDAIAVTDHDAIDASLRAVERAPAYDLLAVPGVEVSTAAGHLLALFVTERPPADRPLDETVRTIRDLGGVAVVPHPFQVSRHGVRKRRLAGADVDGLEVFNALAMTGIQNRRARRFADREDCAPIGASDAHTAAMVGRAHTLLSVPAEAPPVPDLPWRTVRRALLAGRCRPAGDGASVAQYVGKVARTVGSRTAALRPGRLFSADRS